jgi:hypothetical protein
MDIQEARRVLVEYLEKYWALPYHELKKRVNESETKEIRTSSGITYQIEIQVHWVDKSNRNLRVCGTIDDGGWRTFYPLTVEFICTPTGQINLKSSPKTGSIQTLGTRERAGRSPVSPTLRAEGNPTKG